MAGYGLKSFLIAQSLNQIEKAYGPNNSILDNCHVRVSFATNDERTASRRTRKTSHRSATPDSGMSRGKTDRVLLSIRHAK